MFKEPCKECNGTGINQYNKRNCYVCGGSGVTFRKLHIELWNYIKSKINFFQCETYEVNLKDVLDNLPFMIWVKDKNGVYKFANKAVIGVFEQDGLKGIVGKDDKQIQTELKAIYGDSRHTFGDLCMITDRHTVAVEQHGVFLEMGIVKGHDMKAIATKVPFYKDKQIFGSLGLAMDYKNEYDELQKIIDSTDDAAVKIALRKFLKKFEFDENNAKSI